MRWAGAQDLRFAIVMPCLSGAGGGKIIRRNYGETIANLTAPDRFPFWFAPRYADYGFDADRLPVDGHMLLAVIAPRPVLQITESAANWSDPRGVFLASRAAAPVY